MVLSTVGFVLSHSAILSVAETTGIGAAEAERAMAPGLEMLSNSLTLVGALLVGFAAATAFLLARQLTNPLRALAEKVGVLRPGHWQAERTVTTGDEVEVLDIALTDMAGRLAGVYEHQEEEIAQRTEDLRRQYQLDRAILDAIRYGVLAVDKDGMVTQCNPAAVELMGETTEGRHVDEAFRLRMHGGKPLQGEHPVLACLKTAKPYKAVPSARWSIERVNHGLLPITLSVSPLLENGTVFGALIVFQDVTEERHLDYLKSEFITLASHQLRTPLSAIRWYAEMLDDEKTSFTTEQQSYVTEISHSVGRMIALLGSLLHAAKMEDENLKPDLKSINLSSVVADAMRDVEEVFDNAGIAHAINLPKEAVTVTTDPVLLRIVLQNLLGNAAKYSSKGASVRVDVRQEGNRAIFAVTDTGLGIPMASQGRIFEKFFRAENVRRMDTDGNGLGLYISKSIVDRLGGTLTFESIEGKGTTFRVELPNVATLDSKKI